jgi:hypothetical protein
MIILLSEYNSSFLRNGWPFPHMCSHYLFVIHFDHSSRIVSLLRHSGLLRKNTYHLLKMLAMSLIGELRRPTLKWVMHRRLYRYEYSKFLVKKTHGESGFINLRGSPVFYFMSLFLTMISGLPVGASRCVFFLCLLHTHQEVVDTASRIHCSFRRSRQLALVLADVDHIFFS